MLRILPILVLLVVTGIAFAQDSTQVKKTHALSDSLHFTTPSVSNRIDSLSPSVTHYRHSLDSSKRSLNHKIDSLEKLKLPTTKYKHKLDSISRIDPLKSIQQQEAKLTGAEQKVNSSITGTEKKLTQKINSLSSGAEGSLPNTSLPAGTLPSTSLPNVNLPNTNLPASIPNLNLPNESLPAGSLPSSLPSVNNPLTQNPLSKEMSSVTTLPQKEIGELKNAAPLGDVKKDFGEAGNVTKQAQGYGKDVNGVLHGDPASMQRLSQKAENEVKQNVSGLKTLNTENQTLDQYKKLAASAENPEALQKQGLDQVKKQAVNHFAGKEQVLQNAMAEVSKLKQKYHSLNGLANIPKKIPNAMKGKPLIERLVPAINFQVLTGGHNPTVDVNPAVGYRFTKRFTAGAGWNERLTFNNMHVHTRPHFYGPRTYADYLVKGGLSFRAELEAMSSLIPPNQVFVFGDRPRQWLWNSYAGIKKDYRLFRHLKGNAQLLYNVNSLFDRHHINLYGQPVTARIGFEFPMSKKRGKKILK